jgi:hypothetical protein
LPLAQLPLCLSTTFVSCDSDGKMLNCNLCAIKYRRMPC